MDIKVGQIWREVDPRKVRFIRVESTNGLRPYVRTVEKVGEDWKDAYRSRGCYCEPSRFNGKRGGYEYVETDKRYALHFV